MNTITERQKAAFRAGYMEAALWSSADTHPETQEHVCLEDFEWAPGEPWQREGECNDFLAYAGELVRAYVEQRQCPGFYGWECAGHDFWLTRNGHGAGYWDRGLGDLGDKLTAAAKTFGGVDLYLGDDELVYS
ncbi:hypothetical protein ACSC9U_18330 [Pseudomonas solani]|uniref:hypothetical protein n=1 Tax=Pseudomonas solani TaxID=2731552 RepID=UPI003F4AD87E